jgi:hypothetical protein
MNVFIMGINSFVHVVMYGFYFCSSVKSLSVIVKALKPCLTAIQLTQLVLILGQCIAAVLCKHSNFFYLLILNIFILIILFINFYNQTYLKPNKSRVD